MRTSIMPVVLLILLGCWPTGSQAVPVTFSYAGTVKFAPQDSVLQLVGSGTPLSVQLTFDSSLPDQEPDETLGLYPGAITGFAVDLSLFGSYTANSGDVEIDDFDVESGHYVFSVPDLSGPDIEGWTVRGGLLAFNLPRHSEAIPNDDLPLAAPDPRDFGETFLNLEFLAPGADPDCTLLEECLKFVWSVNGLQVVPEPSALSLMMILLAPILLLAESRLLGSHSSLLPRRDTTHASTAQRPMAAAAPHGTHQSLNCQ